VTNVEVYLAIGIPSVLVLIGIFVNLHGTSTLRAEVTSLRAEFHSKFDSGISGLRLEMISLRNAIHDDMVGVHERIAIVEDRTKR